MSQEKGMDTISDQKRISASYILTFADNVLQLTHYFSEYRNLILELESKHGQKGVVLDDGEKQTVLKAVQTSRYYVSMAHVQINAILNNAMESKDDAFVIEENNAYVKIKDQFMINSDDLEKYVTILNGFLLKDIVKELLASAQTTINKIYEI